jgi:hypothetical protein
MKTNLNLWPYGILLTFVLFISGTAGLIVLAATQKTDLVSNNYYEQEIKYQTRIDSLARAKQLDHPASVACDPSGKHILISLSSFEKDKTTGTIQLYRPSAAGMDRQLKLEPDANGVQTLDASGLQKGLWKVRVSWNVNGQDYFLDEKIVIAR